MSVTANLELPNIAAAQQQKHVTHNSALQVLDALVNLSLKDRDLTDPPPSPANGDRYLVASPGGGVWAGKGDHVAAWQEGAWFFYPPKVGWIAWVEDESVSLVYDGTIWDSAGGTAASELGINGATPDEDNKLVVFSDNVLFSHDPAGNGNSNLVVNKAASGDDASLTFQTNFSSRAIIGLLGNNTFAFNVSNNGSSFTEAFRITGSNGRVTFNDLATFNGNGLTATSVTSTGEMAAQTLNLGNLPTSSTGLSNGDVWNDGGTLKVA